MSGPPNKWYVTPLPEDFSSSDIETLLNAYSKTHPTTAAFIQKCSDGWFLFQGNYSSITKP